MSVYLLSQKEIWFPNPSLAEEDGLLAVGGDLSLKRLLLAYMNGIFPWFNPSEDILWWCPKERFVIFPREIVISRSMKKFLKKMDFEIHLNRNFQRTIQACRLHWEKCKDGTWISDDMERAYNRLYEEGYAMSMEVYQKESLVGGLYGVIIGKCFFGESMFSLEENASKVALISLAKVLETKGGVFIDCQFKTDHLERMGGRYISYEEYTALMKIGLREPLG